MTGLSLCAIVKNEERLLPDCLASVRDTCDELVIVDTGSSDRTVDIARDFGARVIEIDWANDFSLARNVALDHASGSWVLQLDADETLAPDSDASVRHALASVTACAWNVPIESRLPSGGTALHYFPRLFRSTPTVRYEGRIHERPRLEGAIEIAEFRILHSGYDADPKTIERKQQRNLALLERWIEEEPRNPEPLFHRTTALLAARRYREAIAAARRTAYAFAALGASGQTLQAAAWNLLGIAQAGLGSWEAAKASHDRAIALDADLVDAYFDLATCFEATGEYEESLAQYSRYHAARHRWRQSQRTDLMLRTVASEAIAFHNAGILHERLGNDAAARDAHRAALTAQPTLVAAQRSLDRLS